MNFVFKRILAFVLCFVSVMQFAVLKSTVNAQENEIMLSESVSRAKNYNEYINAFSELTGVSECESSKAYIIADGVQKEADGDILSNQENFDIGFCFNVSQKGRYNIKVEYKIAEGAASNDVVRSVKINNTVPFSEAERITFERSFNDYGEITKNTLGDEIRPSVREVKEKRTVLLCDSGRFYSDPLEFWFDEGEQTVTLSYVSTDMYIYSVSLVPVEETLEYKEILKGYKNVNAVSDIREIYQAEASMLERSDSSIRMESNTDPAAIPQSRGYKKLNVVGGNRWREGNQSITFSFKVPKSGYYKISFRFLQSWNDGMPSYRKIEIDGKLPCSELSQYRFEYNSNWQTETLNDDGEEMLFYLEKGIHTLKMTVVLGELSEMATQVYDNMLVISDMIQSINKLTGGTPDSNYDYEFFKNIPSLKADMTAVADSLTKLSAKLNEITSKSTSMSSNFKSIASQINKMIKDPFTIAKRIDQLTSAQSNLGTYYSNMQSLPLMLDEFSVSSPDISIKNRKANIFEKISAACYSFILSFTKDYNGVSGTYADGKEIKETIDVWVARGTEWAETVKYLADADFTPKTGILVNMKTVPSSQLNTGSANVLLLSLVSGKAPDVAMGVSANSPVEFAIRDSVCDISKFQDFEQVSARFNDKIFIPFSYNGGVYAIPETMNFNCLFYRKDIFDKYGFSLPDTWDELCHDLLPALYQNGMSFYMPHDFSTFLFQNGGDFYTEDGRYSNLGTNEAYKAFKQYTEMFTNYGTPVNANFLTRFRTGEMPIGVGSFQFYIQLCTAAPELLGSWEIAPLIGTDKGGHTNRSTGGLAAECDIILTGDSEKQEASWEFLKWWTSDGTQNTYAVELESLIGVEARWNSANINAFSSLDWSVNDRAVIEEMCSWATETPVVLGGYYTSRYINNAFNSVVVSGNMTVRDALEEAVESINKELETKQIEYGVISSD